VKIKDKFPNLSSKKIEKVQKILNKLKKNKPEINKTTKGLFRKQVLVSITMVNSNRIIVLSNKHVANINKILKDIKSDVIVEFIRANHRGLMIITNKVVSTSNFNTIEKYIKNVDVINSNNISFSRLPQSKSYLKILGIPDLIKDTNISITSDVIKRVI